MSTSSSAAPDVARPARELTAVLGRILDQLSLSAWMPGLALTGGVALLLVCSAQAPSEGRVPLDDVGEDLAQLSIGSALAFFVLVLIATVVTQAFEFEIIRLLEGYWPTRRPWRRLTRRWVRRELARREQLLQEQRQLEKSAFKSARRGLSTDPVVRQELTLLWKTKRRTGSTKGVQVSIQAQYLFGRWREAVAPEHLRLLESVALRLSWFPPEHRILPTRLGNTLRSREDQLELADGGDLQGFVLRNYERISPPLLTQLSDFRTRLNMYCALTLVAVLLGAFSVPALWEFYAAGRLALVAALTSSGALTVLSYRAAVASAKGYVSALVSSDEEVARKLSAAATTTAGGPAGEVASGDLDTAGV